MFGAAPTLIAFTKGLLILKLVHVSWADSAAAHVLYKRDAPLVTIDIPLTVNSHQRYVVGVSMSSSPDPQKSKFAMAANTGYSAVAGTACNGCDGVPTYNASASPSVQAWPGSENITVGAASIVGPLIKENCSLHEVNGSAWQYPNQTRTLANGAVGDFLDTIYGQWLLQKPTHSNFTFGMALQPPTFTSDDDAGNGGVLHWTLPDSSAYVGDVTWNIANVSSASADAPASSGGSEPVANSDLELPESDWAIEMDGWAISTSGTTVSNSNTSQAIIEPFLPDIYFPQSQAALFYSAIPSAAQISSLIDGAQAWSIPCNAKLSVAFTFSGQSFPVDETQLIGKQSNGTCIGIVKAWPDPTTLRRRSRAKRSQVTSTPSHPNDGEKRKAYQDHDITFDDDVAQYVTHPLTRYAQDGITQIPSPPNSAGSETSSHPFLPEVRYLQGPALDTPNMPNTPTDFLSMSASPSYEGNSGEGGSVINRISYNSSALGANVTASRAAASSKAINQVLPASFGVRGHSNTLINGSSHDLPSSQGDAFSFHSNNTSLPSTMSSGATATPFILSPSPCALARVRDTKTATAPLSKLRQSTETPAPPYTEPQTAVASSELISSTLVEYSPSTVPSRQMG
ncbi:hypothetical protein EW145_g4556 [Phellinidium pouzarii]|uniref:Peptidase A1 domain-containing protein n=1 Tax=Phellinidium pouzarii TaxID=167371 RepID=A0A4S4L309_9AGAM|nr:hypothetical protein EW145_g4556 [Phellinidium pouzarii]